MSALADKTARIKEIKPGKGIQLLINEASRIFGNPILVHDVDFKLVAHTENVITDDPLWNELVTTGEHNAQSQEFFRNEGFFDIVADVSPVTLLSSPKIKYDRIFGKLYNKEKIMVACTDMLLCFKPMEYGDAEAFEAFRLLLQKELNKSPYYRTYGKLYQENLFKKLIDGSIADKTYYSCHVANIYNELKSYLFLAVADIARYSSDYAKLTVVRDTFFKKNPSCRYSIYKNHVIILISSDSGRFNIKEDLGTLMGFIQKNNICVGISRVFENVFDFPKHYKEAVTALNQCLCDGGQSLVYLYDDLVTL